MHIYNATAPAWRKLVFNMTTQDVMKLVEHHVSYLKKLTDRHPETEWILQYSPETFSATELQVSLDACHTAMKAWGAGPNRRVILNLPSTVENATPNIYADQIEWMHRHIVPREYAIISSHCHNDRGTGVAAAEFSVMAGADRVEGCLFGNGERCGNVDLVTLALNLYTQGVNPGLNLSDINSVARVVEECTKLPIHPRHPYVGDLVFTAFSGSPPGCHQEGLRRPRSPRRCGKCPTCPSTPPISAAPTRASSASTASPARAASPTLLERDYGVVMPRRMQVEFSSIVQQYADSAESEMTSPQLWTLFETTYLGLGDAMVYHGHRLFDSGAQQGIEIDVTLGGERRKLRGAGNGPHRCHHPCAGAADPHRFLRGARPRPRRGRIGAGHRGGGPRRRSPAPASAPAGIKI